ncbi:MAG: hypothetical protein M0R33_17315 [Methylomonas sp.]|jgi:hypothetical protein|uniref:hypothetical protein n=1 Tax=Methylomonas sp. TaxID=418 RepID=UPI0025ED7A00|nr:hypothetical protein [Methylomonas sp.]MCK9608207.1 hypothetical protein [Methylomonas sp.]
MSALVSRFNGSGSIAEIIGFRTGVGGMRSTKTGESSLDNGIDYYPLFILIQKEKSNIAYTNAERYKRAIFSK